MHDKKYRKHKMWVSPIYNNDLFMHKKIKVALL